MKTDTEKKLRYSYQREMIYQYLMESQDHPSAEMVYDALRSEIKGLSLGTVYRNLRLLEDLGHVRRVTSLNGTERYDAICGDHVHFVCLNCGLIHDLPEAELEQVIGVVKLPEGYQLGQVNMTISGLCPECLQNQTEKN
ncbi:MAG: transcriptional repressor [Firmicutes bacterium]|nr:transcriptional repressor [Bacillota bacterium]